ncbi:MULTISPECIES: hypothetical protein [unclassified Lysobacter]|uniref:hypothetical protein n=1 Tax=unclassified Lysobacter TaxID=2635362 RepID=UPI001BE4EA71|nr:MULTISPECIES: hypothetical protein [unclassified Lysobacter]MBT2749283.1 hypothetical protein [Lysobacter sp. ISL-42]MBT2753890.1 hypothetical protein [Lysobacter sp. ISL-50]MBT2778950.1 hypothetical protein [Lysobacter sp. ISL-54]MBT2781649.1 hypothetical protein [Lysobacter sp. ISL-52]
MATGRNRAIFFVPLAVVLSACATAGTPNFAGQWGYRQTCGWNHSANLELSSTGKSYTGSWDDGTRVRGDNGQLRGEVQGDRLMLRFCTQTSDQPCSDFDQIDGYAVRKGAALHWYRKSGDGYSPYLVLQQAKAGKQVPADNQCDDEEPKDDVAPER